MKRGRILLSLLIALFLMSFIIAQESCNFFIAENTEGFLTSITELNNNLESCNVEVPTAVTRIIGEGLVKTEIVMSSGETKFFYFSLKEGKIVQIIRESEEKEQYTLAIKQETADALLQLDNPLEGVLNAYEEGNISIKGNGIVPKVKVFIGNIIYKLFFKEG